LSRSAALFKEFLGVAGQLAEFFDIGVCHGGIEFARLAVASVLQPAGPGNRRADRLIGLGVDGLGEELTVIDLVNATI